MKGFARIGIDVAGGILLGKRQDFVLVDGKPVAVLGDLVAPHGKPPHSPKPVMVEGEAWLLIEGIPMCRKGHTASCGHATGGAPWIGVKG